MYFTSVLCDTFTNVLCDTYTNVLCDTFTNVLYDLYFTSVFILTVLLESYVHYKYSSSTIVMTFNKNKKSYGLPCSGLYRMPV